MVMQKVLLIGSGMVTPAFLDTVLSKPTVQVTIGAYLMDEAKALVAKCKDPKRVSIVACDVNTPGDLDRVIPGHDVVVSLVPAPLHPSVAKACIKHKANMCTSSYRSPAMKELDAEAKAAGITIINEFGLDPGMDHLSAVKVIKEMEKKGAKLLEFESWCGGLPAPECANNPLGYKFSWNPRGVLRAATNEALYYKDGQQVRVPGPNLMEAAKPISFGKNFPDNIKFECYPNRDSTAYLEYYDIPGAKTCLRGTVRYEGFCIVIDSWKKIGMFDETPLPELAKDSIKTISWPTVVAKVLHCKSEEQADLKAATIAAWKSVGYKFTPEEEKKLMTAYEWFGLFDKSVLVIKRDTIVDSLCAHMEEKLKLQPTDRDMVVMQHRFTFQYANGKTEKRTSTCVDYGTVGGYTSMAKTVGTPLAIATLFVLDGTFNQKGVICPYTLEMAAPALKELEKHGIKFVEEVVA